MATKKKRAAAKRVPVTTSTHAAGDIAAADRAAGRALLAVEHDAPSQLAALDAVAKLVDVCRAAAPDGVLHREARRLLEERTDAFRAFHLENVQRIVDKRALAGDVDREHALRAIEQAIALVSAVDGESGDVRTLRMRLDEIQRGRPGKPMPFFARYLEHQKR